MLWIKAFHIIAMVCWFAGLFYLPRLFVYHADTSDAQGITRFKTMERKLYFGIMVPSMLATLLFGGWMLVNGWAAYKTMGWMHTKLLLVFLLVGYHHVCGRYMKAFQKDANKHSSTFYRWFNEVPALLLIAIVILAIVKP